MPIQSANYGLRINPGAIGSSNYGLVVDSGNVGIGMTGPTQKLVVSDGTTPDAYCDGNTWVNTSSVRVKENIVPLNEIA